ncbi:unnamed protein product [Colias eurytheme]|nr:unnamed protein product [Colias eurytheme]
MALFFCVKLCVFRRKTRGFSFSRVRVPAPPCPLTRCHRFDVSTPAPFKVCGYRLSSYFARSSVRPTCTAVLKLECSAFLKGNAPLSGLFIILNYSVWCSVPDLRAISKRVRFMDSITELYKRFVNT